MGNGTLYIMDYRTKERKVFGGITEISHTPTDEDKNIYQQFDYGPINIRFELTRKSKRNLLKKFFCLPRYKVTESIFPRKKKRGTMRRARNKRKGHNK